MLVRRMNSAPVGMLQPHRKVKARLSLVTLLNKMPPATHREAILRTRPRFNKVQHPCMEDRIRAQWGDISRQGHSIPHNHSNSSSQRSLVSRA